MSAFYKAAALAALLLLTGCIEPMTLELPRSDATRMRERTTYALLDFIPGTAQLSPASQSRLAEETNLAAIDRSSTLRVALPPSGQSRAQTRTLAAAIARPSPPEGRARLWSIEADTPNLDPDTALLTVIRAALPAEACKTSASLSPDMREAVGMTGCAVITALDMNVADPGDLINANAPPPSAASAVATAAARDAKAPKPPRLASSRQSSRSNRATK